MAPSWLKQVVAAGLLTQLELVSARSQDWYEGKFQTIVTFGDSYTDENRLGYFINHNGSPPPVGWDQPVGFSTASGGLSWARYASYYAPATLYNYAVSGAVCSNQITPRTFTAINAPFPDIAGYEVPAFIADSQYVSANGSKFFTGTPESTVYAIWIGTNDLGNDAFLTDSQVKGRTVADFMDCIYQQVARLYANGARYFVLLNLATLDLLPQYATPEHGGLPATQYFPTKAGKNITEISYRMLETVASLNQVYKYRSPFEASRSNGTAPLRIANFDVNALMTDIYYHPQSYLNGTAPWNVTGVSHPCNIQGQNCSTASSPDSFMWYDALHPGEQTGRVVAREFVKVLSGNSMWATYW